MFNHHRLERHARPLPLKRVPSLQDVCCRHQHLENFWPRRFDCLPGWVRKFRKILEGYGMYSISRLLKDLWLTDGEPQHPLRSPRLRGEGFGSVYGFLAWKLPYAGRKLLPHRHPPGAGIWHDGRSVADAWLIPRSSYARRGGHNTHSGAQDGSVSPETVWIFLHDASRSFLAPRTGAHSSEGKA